MPILHIADTAPVACVRNGDQVTATGRIGIGHITPPEDPAHKAQSYLTITFDPPLCIITHDHPAGEPVERAVFLATRPPLKSTLGEPQTVNGSLELGSEGTNERFSFVTY